MVFSTINHINHPVSHHFPIVSPAYRGSPFFFGASIRGIQTAADSQCFQCAIPEGLDGCYGNPKMDVGQNGRPRGPQMLV